MTKAKAGGKSGKDPSVKVTKSYGLGPQSDGSIIMKIASDYDLMIARKAFEKQKKNVAAARGTVSALADGDDDMLDAADASLDRLLATLNRSRAPEKQISGTPIGDEIDRNRAESQDEHHAGTRRWADAIPRPRPQKGDALALPDGRYLDVVEALGFKGDGLSGSEDEVELQKLADAGNLTGAFEIIVEPREGNVLAQHCGAGVVGGKPEQRNIWRIVGEQYGDRELVPPSTSESGANNIASTVSDVVEKTSKKAAKASGKKSSSKRK